MKNVRATSCVVATGGVASAKIFSNWFSTFSGSTNWFILLSLNQGNISQAARQAGKHRRAFWELMKKHDIKASEYGKNLDPVDEAELVGV